MRALTWQSPGSVSVETVDDPRIEDAGDVVIRVTSAAICGSDIHLYNVFGPYLNKGDVLGHETMGVVEEVGPGVSRLKVGDRVVIPFVIACGDCFFCDRGLTSQCETTQVREQGSGASLYGFTELYGRVPGGQAERLRVPRADFNARVVGAELHDHRYLFLSDILPTAWQGVQYADLPEEGGTLAVLGLGPVGQFAARIGKHLGHRVIAVEVQPERRALAEKYGVETLELTDDVAERIVEMTGGRGADAVIDAVGTEAEGSPLAAVTQKAAGLLPDAIAQKVIEKVGQDRMAALNIAFDAVRRGGTISISGVYAGSADPFPMMQLFDKQVSLRMGQCNVHRWLDDLVPLVERADDPLGTEDLVTHRVPLEKAPEMYETFTNKEDGCIKVVLDPSA
jgi:threonine dehydrogenase-like Zn-dependent dehydrogenase